MYQKYLLLIEGYCFVLFSVQKILQWEGTSGHGITSTLAYIHDELQSCILNLFILQGYFNISLFCWPQAFFSCECPTYSWVGWAHTRWLLSLYSLFWSSPEQCVAIFSPALCALLALPRTPVKNSPAMCCTSYLLCWHLLFLHQHLALVRRSHSSSSLPSLKPSAPSPSTDVTLGMPQTLHSLWSLLSIKGRHIFSLPDVFLILWKTTRSGEYLHEGMCKCLRTEV